MRGWKALTVLLGLIVVFCGVGTWAFITWIAPLIFSTAQLWPTGPNELWRWLCIGGTIAGIVLGFTIDDSPLWTDRLPFLSDAERQHPTRGPPSASSAPRSRSRRWIPLTRCRS